MTNQSHIPQESIIKEFVAEITQFKANFLTGIYLTGSIPLGDFHPGKSDIDFLVLCNKLPTGEVRMQLEQVHWKIKRKFRKSPLSGFYITPDGLNVHLSQTTKTLCFHEGRMKELVFDTAAVTLYELKTTAITLFGIPAKELPVSVELKDVKQFLLMNINTYWKTWIDKHSSFGLHQLLLIFFPRLTEWVILGVARQLYTLRTGKITSKTGAGNYCVQNLPNQFRHIVWEAIKIRNDKGKHFVTTKLSYYAQPSIKRYRETIKCANYIIRLFNDEYNVKSNP